MDRRGIIVLEWLLDHLQDLQRSEVNKICKIISQEEPGIETDAMINLVNFNTESKFKQNVDIVNLDRILPGSLTQRITEYISKREKLLNSTEVAYLYILLRDLKLFNIEYSSFAFFRSLTEYGLCEGKIDTFKRTYSRINQNTPQTQSKMHILKQALGLDTPFGGLKTVLS